MKRPIPNGYSGGLSEEAAVWHALTDGGSMTQFLSFLSLLTGLLILRSFDQESPRIIASQDARDGASLAIDT